MKIFKIVDIFHSIQGEGFHAGSRALFIRMPFCNLKCSWCDTEFNTFKNYSEEDLNKIIDSEPCRFAVITGGEPLLNKQTPEIIKFLEAHGFHIACETNGSFPYLKGIHHVACSPKRDNDFKIHPALIDNISELKIVIDRGFDLSLLNLFENTVRHALLYLSPEWNDFEENLNTIIEYQRGNPKWKISLQTHKIMKIE